jgi:hypothetical protein
MVFGRSIRSLCGAFAFIAWTTNVSVVQVNAWVAPIVTKGNKLFDSATGVEFRIKGMAYYPRPNVGNLSVVTGYDFTTDDYEAIWKPHLEIMKDLGVNTIRLYSVDPGKSHDKFMCAASDAGIYVLVGMSAPCLGCHITDDPPPKCYTDEMATRSQMIYNAFAVYDNTLGFSVGNENNLQPGQTVTAPCVKALIRDVKNYADICAGYMRRIPIGLDLADIEPRAQWLQYYDCSIDDNEFTRADWIGFNPYVECDPLTNTEFSQSKGLQNLMKEYTATGYSRPIMFGEFGCNLGENTIDGYENQRQFYDAKWMNEEKEMTDVVVGGNVFEFTTEVANTISKQLTTEKDAGKFGVGFFLPEDCDHKTTTCEFQPYPEYENLKTAYTTTKASTLTMNSFTPALNNILECPSKNISIELPPVPNVEVLACSVAQPKCNGKLSNNQKKQASSNDNNKKLGGKKTASNNEQDVTSPAISSRHTVASLTVVVATFVAALMNDM